MPAAPSKLQLKYYYLKELSYFLKDSLEKEPTKKTHQKTVELEITDLTTPVIDVPGDWRCELTIKSTNSEKDHFYDFRIVLVGFFTIEAGIEPELASLIAETNAPAILYSTSREIVGTVTRRSPYPGTLLPAVTFLKQSGESTPATPPAKKVARKARTK